MLYKMLSVTMLFLCCCSDREIKQETTTASITDTDPKASDDLTMVKNMDSLQRSTIDDSAEIHRIDLLRKKIDSDQSLSTKKFSITALKKARHTISYEYKEKDRDIQMIRRQFSKKQDTIIQVFYLQDNSLVYASETINSYYSKDPITWAGDYYFSRGKMISHVTLGHGKSEGEDPWDPEQEMLSALREAHRDIKRSKVKKRLNYLYIQSSVR